MLLFEKPFNTVKQRFLMGKGGYKQFSDINKDLQQRLSNNLL